MLPHDEDEDFFVEVDADGSISGTTEHLNLGITVTDGVFGAELSEETMDSIISDCRLADIPLLSETFWVDGKATPTSIAAWRPGRAAEVRTSAGRKGMDVRGPTQEA